MYMCLWEYTLENDGWETDLYTGFVMVTHNSVSKDSWLTPWHIENKKMRNLPFERVLYNKNVNKAQFLSSGCSGYN